MRKPGFEILESVIAISSELAWCLMSSSGIVISYSFIIRDRHTNRKSILRLSCPYVRHEAVKEDS